MFLGFHSKNSRTIVGGGFWWWALFGWWVALIYFTFALCWVCVKWSAILCYALFWAIPRRSYEKYQKSHPRPPHDRSTTA